MSEKKQGFGFGKSLYSAGGAALVLLILIFINAIVSQANLRWDATEDNLYSLSEGTREILSDMEQDVTIKVFYSEDNVNVPVHIKTYARRMLDFLSEYEYYSDGRVRVETYNPEPDSEAEDWARKYGIEPINIPAGDRLYFGLVAVAADQEEVIPSLDPTREAHLEYDITRLVSRLQSPTKPRIGIISDLPVFGSPPMGMMQQQGREPWLYVEELRKSFDVEQIGGAGDPLSPDDYDLVILHYAKNAAPALLYAVDQYVLAGGDLVVFADPFSVSDSAPGQPGQVQSAIPATLLPAWGVAMEENKVVVDFDYATRLRNQQNQVENNPVWLSVGPEGFNSDEIITAELESMLLPAAGAITKLEDAACDYEPLIRSSKNSALTESFRAQFDARGLRQDFNPTVDQYDLAVRIQGTFKTAFPDGKPAGDEPGTEGASDDDAETAGEGLKEGAERAIIILVADADLLFDNFYVNQQNLFGFQIAQVFNDNLNFLLNAAEMLTGSESLISIRSRGKFERPFTRVEELEKKARSRWLAREQELVRKVEETNRKLRQLEGQKDPSQEFIVSEKQEAEIEKFQEEKRRIQQELKRVRRNLRADIEALGTKLKFVNIFLVPLLVSFAGLGYALYRRKQGR
jgi:ABC-type uncharacterized transport system involved in gliding motility auxiliary subunit